MKIRKIKPVRDHIIVTDMSFGERLTNGGIVLLDDDKKSEGIRPRWARVFATGPEQKEVTEGMWVLVAHGRWTRGITVTTVNDEKITLRRVDNNDILLVSDTPMQDETWGLTGVN